MDSLQYAVVNSLDIERVEKIILLVIGIMSSELLIKKEVTGITIGAWSSISGWSYTSYKYSYSEIHNSIQKIYMLIQEYRESEALEAIEIPYIHDDNDWVAYFAKAHKQLLS